MAKKKKKEGNERTNERTRVETNKKRCIIMHNKGKREKKGRLKKTGGGLRCSGISYFLVARGPGLKSVLLVIQ